MSRRLLICMHEHSVFNVCCMKRICKGCDLTAKKRQIRGMFDCAFCGTPYPDTDAEMLAMIQARAEKKDPDAISNLGMKYYFGSLGLQKDACRAAELWTEAVELGSIEALLSLGHSQIKGRSVP